MQNLKYRLGLDLGTNSIGWAIYSLDSKNEVQNLEDLGVRIFSDGRDPKTKEPLAVERRNARGSRKLIYRRKLRRRETFRILQEQGLFPKNKEDSIALKNLNPYELRVKALDGKLKSAELARVLFNLSVRRGFKSNRKDNKENLEKENSKSEKLSQSDMQNNLQNAIKESNCRTLGEFLWKNKGKNNGLRFVPGRMDYYPLRQMYIDEFDAIKNAQEKFFPNVDWKAIRESIFFQRPMKSPDRGSCQYMPEKERTWKSMPCSEKLRALQEVRNLNYTDENAKSHPISEEQEKIILDLLYTKDSVKFDAMRKALDLNGKCVFNLERGNRTELKGCSTAVKMRSEKRFGKLWDKFSLEEQDEIVEKIFDAKEDEEIFDFLSKYDLSEEQKASISKINLPAGTSSLCREVSEQLVHKMKMQGMQVAYNVAVEMLGYKYADQSVEKFDELPYYGKVLVGSTTGVDNSAPETNPEKRYGKIANPTVHVALNQTRTVVNALIREYGKPSQIVVELSRDLKASREAKADLQRKQNDNAKRNAILNNKISENFKIAYPNREDRLKYRLWEELGAEGLPRKCIYCGRTISGAEIFTNEIQVEHILPFGRTLCDAESNKTVAHASCNAFKGERSPFEAFGSNPKGYNWSEILSRANALKDKTKRSRFSEDAMETFEKESTFITRQLTDNAYLSRAALKYLKSVCDDVWSVNGGMTKLLRDKWKIDSILKRKIGDAEIAHFGLKDEQIGTYKKNRYDHRHHALDATVIALIDRSMVQQISRLNQIRRKDRLEVPTMPVLHSELVEKVREIVPSHKPDHGWQSKLSKETLLGKIKREKIVPISKITKEEIAKIKNEKVRADFENKLNESGDIKKARIALKDIYPEVKIYEYIFVARTPIIVLGEKNINDIIDLKIRNRLNDFIAAHKGEKLEDVLQKFSKETGIKKLRCKNKDQVPIEIKPNKNCPISRFYAVDSYCGAIIWEIPAQKEGGNPNYKAQFIRYDELDDKGQLKDAQRPSDLPPTAKKLKIGDKQNILYKGDYLEFSDNGKLYKALIKGFAASLKCFDIRPVCAVNMCNDWIISTAENMLDGCTLWLTKNGEPKAHQNFITVSALFGEKQAKFITVNPIGRVFRKTQN